MDKYLELCHNQDKVMESLMLTAPMPVLQAIQDSFSESVLADMYAEDKDLFAESVPVRTGHKLSAKQRRAARRVQNHAHKVSDRLHGKRRNTSNKNMRRWSDDTAQMGRAQVLWCENHRGEYVPSHTIDRGYHEKRYQPCEECDTLARLTASVLAEIDQYRGYVGYSYAVMDLVEELHHSLQYDLPDYAYACHTRRGGYTLVLEYEEYDQNWEMPYTRNVYVDLQHLI